MDKRVLAFLIVVFVALFFFFIVLPIFFTGSALVDMSSSAGEESKLKQSESYWSIARPFAIQSASINRNGTGSITVQNMDASEIFTIKKIELGGVSMSVNVRVPAGESRSIQLGWLPPGERGQIYEFPVVISYVGPAGTQQSQQGAKKLVGRYA